MRLSTIIPVAAALATVFVVAVPRWHGPVPGQQVGYRGYGNVQFPPTEPAFAKLDAPPPAFTAEHYGVEQAALDDTRPATDAYPGITVPPGTTAGGFMKLQVAITNWTAPQQGCAFCHAGTDFKSEAKPQKQAARVMTSMVQTLNADWSSHVAEAGVTCYTCHRGQNVPPVAWYPRQSAPPRPFVAKSEDWNYDATTVRDFFPDNGFAEYLLQDTNGHVLSDTALPTTGPASPQVLARHYEFMMQMSDGIGVNCGYCHNSRSFSDWNESTPARWVGMSGITMTRAINNDTLLPLARAMPQLLIVPGAAREPVVPADEAGAHSGNALAVCATCHYGNPKPLNGLNLVRDQPILSGQAKQAESAIRPATGVLP